MDVYAFCLASFLVLEYKFQPFAILYQIGQSDKIFVYFVLTLTNNLFVKEYLIFRQALTGVTPEMNVMNEEVFGHVAVISVFDTMDEAVALANGTVYGLGASVWTKNLDIAMRMSSQLECGMVWINEICTMHPQCPWGGIKHSGMGKDLSRYGIREFVNIKHVNINVGTEKRRVWWFPYGK